MYDMVTATITTLDCDTMQYSQICGTCDSTNIKCVAMQLSDDLLRIKKRDCTGSSIIRLQQDDKGFPCTSFTEIKLNSKMITDRKLENYKRNEKLANILLQGLKIITSKKDTTSKLQRVSDVFF